MRNPNGYGSIKKLSGNRRKPFAVYVTTGWKFEDGKAKQVQKAIGYYHERREAMIALAEYNKKPYELDKRNTTFRQVYDILYETVFSKMKKSSKSGYIAAMHKCTAIENIKMIDLRKAHMQQIMDENKSMSKSTLNNLLILFHAIYKFSLENDICEKDYSKFVTLESEATKKEKKVFTREEVQILWDNLDFVLDANNRNIVKRSRLMDLPLIQIYTGVRPSELLDMRKDDIHLEERWIDLKGTKTASAKRVVPIHKKIVPLLEERLKADNEYICFSASNKKISYLQYTEFFLKPMCKALGLQDHTAHECRHTFTSFANEVDMNKTYLKKIVGHSSGDITEDVYTHATIEKLVHEIDKLNL